MRSFTRQERPLADLVARELPRAEVFAVDHRGLLVLVKGERDEGPAQAAVAAAKLELSPNDPVISAIQVTVTSK